MSDENYNHNFDVVVILGCHRSGTSLLTGILQKLGMELSLDLISAKEDNPKGYFESNRIISIHDNILKLLGQKWSNCDSLTEYKVSDLIQNSRYNSLFKSWIKDIILQHVEYFNSKYTNIDNPNSCKSNKDMKYEDCENKNELNIPTHLKSKFTWGFKDPRTSKCLSLWESVFQELHIKPCYILAIRSPECVVNSLKKRYPQTLGQYWCILWIETYVNIFQQLQDVDSIRMVIDYDEWFINPIGQAEQLMESIALDKLRTLGRSEIELRLKDFIEISLRHFSKEITEFQDVFFVLANELYQNMKSKNFDNVQKTIKLFQQNLNFHRGINQIKQSITKQC